MLNTSIGCANIWNVLRIWVSAPPTIGWLDEALKETRELLEAPAAAQPVLYLLGLEEEIVSPEPSEPLLRARRMLNW